MFLKKKAAAQTVTEEQIACLRLARTSRIGPMTFRKLIEGYGAAIKALEALPKLSKAGGKKFEPQELGHAEAEIDKLTKSGGQLITYNDPHYPEQLKAIEDAPPVLSIIGDVSLLNKPQLGIVGARNASLNAKKMTARLADEIGAQGYVVTSGMARGIDTSAHEGALEAGTIAVLAGGVDQIYPKENTKLYEALAEKGCLVAENAFGVMPAAQHFPRRNRIVSGLSRAILVVEATERSGSLITARMALEQGREVMAIPGYPADPRASGPNKLIRDGATLIRNTEDIMEALNSWQSFSLISTQEPEQPLLLEEESSFEHVENARDLILDQLTSQPIAIDELIRACHLSVSEVNTTLLALELAGHVQRLPGNRICKLQG